jgi:hypothetical protein
MKIKYFNSFVLILAIIFVSGNFLFAQRETVNFNDNWFFTKGNPANASATQLTETGWEKIKLPHDWAISGHLILLVKGTLENFHGKEKAGTENILRPNFQTRVKNST